MNLVKKSKAAIETNAPSYAVRQERIDEYHTEWDEPPALTIDERGMIRDCSKSGEKLFGYRRDDLVWQHVSRLFPKLSGVALVQEGRFNPLLNFLCRCGQLYQSQNQRGDAFSCYLSFVPLEHDGMRTMRLVVSPYNNPES